MRVFPSNALEQHIAILGKTGSGKTYAAKGLVEGILSDQGRVCVIDPTGAWHGLRSSASGKKAGFAVVIFGGLHADLPLGAAHGEAIAEIIGTASTPAIIDTSQMRVGERTRFFADFADALIRKNRGPLHLVIDEAHLFAPQGKVNDPQSGAMLHAANNLVSLGRSRGLRIILITQRPAKLHKDSLTQVETLVALRLIAPQDRKAVEEWIKDNADEVKGREIISSLATLKTGQGWVWAPELGILNRLAFPKIATFDSSRAPDGGAGDGPVFAPIDKNAIAARLETVAKDALANDPARLKAKIAELERAKAAPVAIDPAAVTAAEQRGYHAGWNAGTKAMAAAWQPQMDAVITAARGLTTMPMPSPDTPRPAPSAPPQKPSYAKPATPKGNGGDPDRPLGAERKPLGVLAGVYPSGMTEAQWAVGAGLKRTGGTWAAYVSRLRAAGRIEECGDLFYATEQGIADLGGQITQLPPPGPELVAYWSQRISGVGPMLRTLADRYPEWVSRDELAGALNLAASGGTFNAYLSRLRSPGLIEDGADKQIRAAASLMEGI